MGFYRCTGHPTAIKKLKKKYLTDLVRDQSEVEHFPVEGLSSHGSPAMCPDVSGNSYGTRYFVLLSFPPMPSIYFCCRSDHTQGLAQAMQMLFH